MLEFTPSRDIAKLVVVLGTHNGGKAFLQGSVMEAPSSWTCLAALGQIWLGKTFYIYISQIGRL
jgi:hypothetical protein